YFDIRRSLFSVHHFFRISNTEHRISNDEVWFGLGVAFYALSSVLPLLRYSIFIIQRSSFL
ncbi:MAG: hypothetical protein PHE03_12190, partial [Bacteroidales bacterium]|nr:hypothetical protein [Bacteroidales bacterium]